MGFLMRAARLFFWIMGKAYLQLFSAGRRQKQLVIGDKIRLKKSQTTIDCRIKN